MRDYFGIDLRSQLTCLDVAMEHRISPQQALDTILSLAHQIARTAPECAEQAMQIAELAVELSPEVDWMAVHDAIEAEMMDSGLSESEIASATNAVLRAVRRRKERSGPREE